ncbi:hypothetical protein [Marinicrinis sediminis]|uniref:ABC transporter permease n=1 Tax=Marinicrinis sediminis TaxID=1652465 RepID=A0ABW5R9Y4_9BACL
MFRDFIYLMKYNLRLLQPVYLLVLFLTFLFSLASISTNIQSDVDLLNTLMNIFGGKNPIEMSVIQIMYAYFPYLLIGLIVEAYIYYSLGSKNIFSLIRINSRRIFNGAQLATVGLLVLVFFISYYLIYLSIWHSFYDMNPIYTTETSVVILMTISIQWIGAYTISLVQIVTALTFNKNNIGYLVMILIYFVHILFPQNNLVIGQNILLGKMHWNGSRYAEEFLIIFVLVNLLVCLLLFLWIRRKNNLIFIDLS